jgi:hypothetical protein
MKTAKIGEHSIAVIIKNQKLLLVELLDLPKSPQYALFLTFFDFEYKLIAIKLMEIAEDKKIMAPLHHLITKIPMGDIASKTTSVL